MSQQLEADAFTARRSAIWRIKNLDIDRREELLRELYREFKGYPTSLYSRWLAQCLVDVENGLIDMLSPLQWNVVECIFEVTRTMVRMLTICPALLG